MPPSSKSSLSTCNVVHDFHSTITTEWKAKEIYQRGCSAMNMLHRYDHMFWNFTRAKSIERFYRRNSTNFLYYKNPTLQRSQATMCDAAYFWTIAFTSLLLGGLLHHCTSAERGLSSERYAVVCRGRKTNFFLVRSKNFIPVIINGKDSGRQQILLLSNPGNSTIVWKKLVSTWHLRKIVNKLYVSPLWQSLQSKQGFNLCGATK